MVKANEKERGKTNMPTQFDRDSDLAKLLLDIAHNLTCEAGEARRLGTYRVHISAVDTVRDLFATQYWDFCMEVRTETGRKAVAAGAETWHDAAARALEEDGGTSEYVLLRYVYC